MDAILFREKKSLRDLKREGLISRLPEGTEFSGSFSGMEEFGADLKSTVLKGVKLNSGGLKLVGITKAGREVAAHILADDRTFLRKMESRLAPFVGRFIEEVYGQKLLL